MTRSPAHIAAPAPELLRQWSGLTLLYAVQRLKAILGQKRQSVAVQSKKIHLPYPPFPPSKRLSTALMPSPLSLTSMSKRTLPCVAPPLLSCPQRPAEAARVSLVTNPRHFFLNTTVKVIRITFEVTQKRLSLVPFLPVTLCQSRRAQGGAALDTCL